MTLRQHLLHVVIWLYVAMPIAAVALGQAGGGQPPGGTGGINATHQRDKPYLILVSIDGFRWDYQDLYPTPGLDRIAAGGVRAERLLPVWPTLTFPNHYSIATGLYPARHGLVANKFFDRGMGAWYAIRDRDSVESATFYAGEPIWVTAEKQGMVSAAFFFVGTEAAIGGVQPTHWRRYDKSIGGAERVDQVLAWLNEPPETRPHLYMLYFEDVDDNAHWYGPDSEQGAASVQRVDAFLARLLNGLGALPHGGEVNILVVSDHGQRKYRRARPPFVLGEHVGLDDMTVIEGGSYAYLYFQDPDPRRAALVRDTVNDAWNSGTAWLPGDTPASWNIRPNGRYPDVIIQPDPGFAVVSHEGSLHKVTAGDHGWAPEDPAMQGIFLASGPDIDPGVSLGVVRIVDIYPLMLGILGLEAPAGIDGDPDALRQLLRPAR